MPRPQPSPVDATDFRTPTIVPGPVCTAFVYCNRVHLVGARAHNDDDGGVLNLLETGQNAHCSVNLAVIITIIIGVIYVRVHFGTIYIL
jgi:hypothetical protein